MSRVIRLRLSPWMVQLVSGIIEQLPKHPSRHICLSAELLPQEDPLLREAWEQSLVEQLGSDYTHLGRTLARLRVNGVADLNNTQTEAFLRIITNVRLQLQRENLSGIPAADLQSDSINIDTLPEESQPAYACYLLLADIQEQIIEQLLQNDRTSDEDCTPAEIDFIHLEEESDTMADAASQDSPDNADNQPARDDDSPNETNEDGGDSETR